jgi:phage/plasmid-like protein (TIGR03299 family)
MASGPVAKGIVNAESGELLGVFSEDYPIHGYEEWTMGVISSTLDTNPNDLGIKSVGRLRRGGQVWLQVRMAETFEVGGFGYRPFITAATSADGSLASTWFTGVDAAVCDNTLTGAMLGADTMKKVRHTSKSAGRLGEIREALGIVFLVAEGFEASAMDLMTTPVSDREWQAFLDEIAPMPEDRTTRGGKRAATLAESKRSAYTHLWTSDDKVAPWTGTAFGVVQADNTWRTWNRTVQGADGGRMERNFTNMVEGKTEKEDAKVLAVLSKVLGRQLLATS